MGNCCKRLRRYCETCPVIPDAYQQVEQLDEQWCINGIKYQRHDTIDSDTEGVWIDVPICNCSDCQQRKMEDELVTGRNFDVKTRRRKIHSGGHNI